ncbi:MAG: hypothetical protein HY246_11570, partial [Proteobacteria bacterium]|nr:hypothetical protein [Pseudomonadota bacterium]
DDVMRTVGGASALDRVGDPHTATAMADALFNHGRGSGAELVQKAVNQTIKELAESNPEKLRELRLLDKNLPIFINEAGGFGPETYNAVQKLAPDHGELFRNKLADERGDKVDRNTKTKIDQLTEKFAKKNPSNYQNDSQYKKQLQELLNQQAAIHERIDHFRFPQKKPGSI